VSEEQHLRRAGKENILFVSDSESDADLFYATRFLVGDPMIYLELEGRKILLVSDLELGRARKEAQVDEVLPTSPIEDALRAAGRGAPLTHIVAEFLATRGVEKVVVSSSLSLLQATKLRQLGIEVECRDDPFFPERLVKSDAEIDAIHATQQAAEEAMGFVIDEIRNSRIDGGYLHRVDEPLTATWLQREAHKLLLERDCQAVNTIIAGGDLGCDPHQRGFGPLPANKTIIIDIFPRSLTTRYWGDITRTVVRGKATPEARKLHEDVHAAQEEAIGRLRDGVDGVEIHQGVISCFEARGNVTEKRDGAMVGYFHGTGHGVGLEIHEQPRMGKMTSMIHTGHTVTVEPGLYYPGVGAVRLEDTVVVTETGHRNLTTFPKDLEV